MDELFIHQNVLNMLDFLLMKLLHLIITANIYGQNSTELWVCFTNAGII